MALQDYDDLVVLLEPFESLSAEFGGKLKEQSVLFLAAIKAERDFLEKAIAMKDPGEDAIPAMIAPISELMQKVGAIKDSARGDAFFNHLTAVAEGIPALGWIVVPKTPAPYAKEMLGSAQFWTNKILKEFKGKDEKQVAWATSLTDFLKALPAYILKFHTTGVAWNSGGAKAAPVAAAAAGSASAGALQSDLEDLIDEFLPPFMDASEKLGEPVVAISQVFKKAVESEKALILKAAGLPKKPEDGAFMELLTPTSTLMGEVGALKDMHRGHKLWNNLMAVAEGTPLLGWVAVEPTPAPFAKDMLGAAQFYTNKILKEYKGKDEDQVKFATTFVALLSAFPKYILAHHTTGLRFNAAVAAPVSAGVAAPTAGSIADFDALVEEHFSVYLSLSAKIGGKVAEQSKFLEVAVTESKKLYEHASVTKTKPAMDKFQELLAPIAAEMQKVGEVKDTARGDKDFDFLNAVAEGVQVLGWVTIEPLPAPFAKDMAGSAQFWGNKILKAFKGSDEDKVNWVKALNGFFGGFEGYIKQHHTTGLSWGNAPAPAAAAVSAPSGGTAEGDFEALIADHLVPFLEIAKKIGGPVGEQADVFVDAVKEEKALIVKAMSVKKPSIDGLMEYLKPTSILMAKVGEFKDSNRGHKDFNHLTALAEAVQVLGWVAVEPAPAPFAKEMVGGAQFWTNKILKEYRGKDATHEAYVKNLIGFLSGLAPYIIQHHTTGLTWGK
eukprot:TRINITY_DN70_c0_g1_i1.p1 TRINITY_DN70_c0_g1~~TRINITY_DN70_c0_g1_i1.p1  ORF type:complete len:723 (-),score=265.99 TRINITY_DN70_c0_g1_i1:83-2251(-)